MSHRARLRSMAGAPVLLSAALASAPGSAVSQDVVFAPHRAVYDIALARSSAGAGVAALTGRMVYELTGAGCVGYTQKMRFVTIMTNEDGAETVNDLRNSSWESAGGRQLRFSNSQYQNDTLADAARGDASRGIVDNAGRTPQDPATIVELVKPTKKRTTLPSTVYFPIQHAEALLTAAKNGAHMLKAELFDGSEKGEKVYLTSAVIGNPYPVEKTHSKPIAAAPAMSGLASWPMTISYFERGKGHLDQTPSYELHFRYYANGVTDDLSIDYGNFAIESRLKKIEFLPPARCPGKSAANP